MNKFSATIVICAKMIYYLYNIDFQSYVADSSENKIVIIWTWVFSNII